jgi:hypothetical protein
MSCHEKALTRGTVTNAVRICSVSETNTFAKVGKLHLELSLEVFSSYNGQLTTRGGSVYRIWVKRIEFNIFIFYCS